MLSLGYLNTQQQDRLRLMANKKHEWQAYTELYFSAEKSKYIDSEESPDQSYSPYSSRKKQFFFQRDFQAKTVCEALQLNNKNYVIKDTLPVLKWKILNDIKEVAGHVCMDAELDDTIRNQKIVAWFALDIPSAAGPERFYGLPGLILELDVNAGAMVLVADKLELKPLTAELDLPKKLKGKEQRAAEFDALLKKHIAEKKRLEEPWYFGFRY